MAQPFSADTPPRIFNFAAGPGVMPAAVLEQAQRELLDWNGHGLSILEMPFTGDEFRSILQQARDDLRALLHIPDNFHILFMHGGASAQFSLIPLNLLGSAGPDKLVDAFANGLGPEHGRVRLHFYPFGGLAKTVEWIRDYNARHGIP